MPGPDPDPYSVENRSRIIKLEEKVGDIQVNAAASVAKLDALGGKLQEHMVVSREQAEALGTGMTDLKKAIEEERQIQAHRRLVEDDRRAALEAEEEKRQTALAQAHADKWATLRNTFTPQTLIIILSLLGGLIGKSAIDAQNQATLIEQLDQRGPVTPAAVP